MAYDKINWKDHVADKPLTYEFQENEDGSKTLKPKFGDVTQEGTPLSAENLNHMDQGIYDAHTKITKLEEEGGKAAQVAEKLKTPRNITISGGATGATSKGFDGSANADINVSSLNPDALGKAVPITKGGTGATTDVQARANLGITPENIGAAKTAHTHTMDNLTGTLPLTKGGTGATTADNARAALKAAAASHHHALTDLDESAATGEKAGLAKLYGAEGENTDGAMTQKATKAALAGKAAASHKHSVNDLTDTLPVTKGGTGATTDAQARTNLKITPENIGAAKTSHTHALSDLTSAAASGTVAGLAKLYGEEGENTDGAMTQKATKTALAGKAATGHNHTLDSLNGTLSLTKGGTGATTAGDARTNLGITPENIGAAKTSHTHAMDNLTGTLPLTKGGTGAGTAEAARTNLGITLGNLGAAAASHRHNLSDLNNPAANGTTAGLTKLYGETGDKTDGAMTQKATTDAINGIEIGGRNLLINSDFGKGTEKWKWNRITAAVSTLDEKSTLKITSDAQSGGHLIYQDAGKLQTGQSYTLSGWVYTSESLPINIKIEHSKESNMSFQFLKETTEQATTGWRKISVTGTLPADSPYIRAIFRMEETYTNKVFYLWHPKLEMGTKATDWTPAPEDMATVVALNGKTDKSALNVSKSDTVSFIQSAYPMNEKNKVNRVDWCVQANAPYKPQVHVIGDSINQWHTLYSEQNKPTAADVGALAAGGTAVAANKLATGRKISITGGATGTTSANFDGSADATINVTALDATKLSAAVPIAKGGTGATDAAGARAKLGIGNATASAAGITKLYSEWRGVATDGAITQSAATNLFSSVVQAFRHIECGTETNIGSGVDRTVTFSETFATTPIVVVTAHTLAIAISCNITTTGFTIKTNQRVDVDWIAVDPQLG